jgi:hypothetical protein
VGRDGQGKFGVGPLGFKYSGSSNPPARIYVLHNTIVANPTSPTPVSGGDQFAGGRSSPEAFYLRNNIVHGTKYAFNAPVQAGRWDERHNYLSTTDTTRGLQFGPKYTTDVQAYRNRSGQGEQTNVTGNFVTPPGLVAPGQGNLALPPGSPLIDAGAPVPNVSDRPGVDFTGAAPDLGAREHRA